jgi:uncharacterized protein YdaU (DUF1376 family)
MSALPYFKWYPGDAETDEKYSSMTDAELGFYHRCLNRSWLNDGLPVNLDELARVMKVSRKYLDRVWTRVGMCFAVSDSSPDRMVNPRQEKERQKAKATSEHNKRPGNANASRPKREREPNGAIRAYESESVSESKKSEGVWGKTEQAAYLKEIGWSGIKRATTDQIESIMAIREDRLEEDPDLKSLYMIRARLFWFDEAWEPYWRKVDKKVARIAYFEAVETLELHDIIVAAIVAQSPAMLRRPEEKRPHFATWIHHERWGDRVPDEQQQGVLIQ